jgi:hypothetical protein
MIQKISLVLATILLLLVGVVAARAQGDTGTISGWVYRTENANGTCTEDDLPGEPGVPLQFVNRDNDTTVNITTNNDGSYEFIAASAGTWQITVNPGSDWRVLSQQTRQVVINDQNPDHEDIDFCIYRVTTAQGTAVPTITPGTAVPTATQVTPAPTATQVTPVPTSQPVLPQSGAPAAPSLLIAAGLGVLFLITGLFIYVRSK